jgi:hypothetical protein
MPKWIGRLLCAFALVSSGCGGGAQGGERPTLAVSGSQREVALPAAAALQRGDFDEAERLAREQIAADDANPYPRLVRAIAAYQRSTRQLALDGRTLVASGVEAGTLNQKYLRTTFGDAERDLALVEDDLAFAAKRSGIALELCLACWEMDWNGNKRIDDGDRRLFEIEMDEAGEPIPEGDPRRKPTFRFDDGDVAWARAFVSFERAILDVLLAYDWSEVMRFARRRSERPDRVVVRLSDRDRIAQAKERFLEGLEHSDAARRAYLAETDDDREWVPSPAQRSHPMPMPVDQALYRTWEGVVDDARRIVRGDDGVHVGDLLLLAGERAQTPPRGYLDVGRMLTHPKDIVIDTRDLARLSKSQDIDPAMKSILGEYYVEEMHPSPLPRRLARMKGEIDRNEEEMERKIRYLLWLN